MSFIQIIDYTTSRADEIQTLGDKMMAEQSSESKARRVTIVKDRDREGHYLTIVEFDSYEEAMQNSEAPATQEFAARFAELLDGPPQFLNLDVIRQDAI